LFTEEAPGFFRRFGQFGVDAMSRSTMRVAAANWARGVSGPAGTVVGTALSQLIGTPLGYAHPDTPIGGQHQGGWNDGVHDSIRDLF
jgi:hypothetical protein